MTPQESSMLEDLVRKVEETELTEKDPEAEQLLQEGLGGDPDAIYKLAQTVLVQNLALNQARTQIQQMQQTQQQAQPARATSFLGGLLGHRDPAPPAPQPQYQQPQYQPQSANEGTQPQFYLIAFNDHSIQAAMAYKVEGDQLYWQDRDNKEHHAPLSKVDVPFSQQINRDRNVDFQIP